MKRSLLLGLLVSLNFIIAFSQVQYKYSPDIGTAGAAADATNANVSGHTVDALSDSHVGFISISLKGTTIGTATDATGHYYLANLPVGEFTIVASAIGYKPIEKKISLEKNKTIEVNFKLEEDAIMLNNIVVSANRNETKRREASNIVNVLSAKLFETTNAVCLAQGLNFQPGLRVENNCQNCGFQQVRINGLDGPYSQILIDSRPIFSALAGVYGLEQIPANMIERVEVVRGGGSALFGSNAIAGTINIITKEPLNNTIAVNNTTMLVGGTKADINTSFNAALVSDNRKLGISIYGSTREREAWDANGDVFSEIGLINSKNLGFRSYFKTSMQSKLTVEYHALNEFRRGGNKLDMPAHNADITEQTEHTINSGGLKWEYFTPDNKHRYNVFSSAQSIARSSYYGSGQDPNAYGKTDDLAFVSGMQYAYAMDKLLFMPAEFTVGTEYNYNSLFDEQLGYDRTIKQDVNIWSGFLQNEWKNKTLNILLGLRADKHNLIKNTILSPRVNLRYNPIELINLRASYASGFRAPQAFDEDLHITAVGGDVQLIQLDPNLRPEKSNSFSLSSDFYKQFGGVQTNVLVEAFYTNINDVFYLQETGTDAKGNSILTRTNGSGAVVKGINIEGKVVPSVKLNFQGGYTIQESKYKKAQTWSENPNIAATREMFRSPNQYGYFTASYIPVKPLTLALTGTYTGTMLVQHFGVNVLDNEEVWTPNFFDMNVKVSYDIEIFSYSKLQLNAGVQNIFNSYQSDFDIGENRDAGYVYGPSLPRSFFVGAKLSL